ncbi:MAG: hypothetical protein RLY43_2406 [Bacteroidota bacterium]|jgi:glycosyl transferase family 25
MGVSLVIKKTSIDKIYVLSVRSFFDRIEHIKNELGKHNIKFEFIFDYDIDQIELDPIIQKKFSHSRLSNSHISLILKHIQAWKNCVTHNYNSILVLEDDVILHKEFPTKLLKIQKRSTYLLPGFLIFLGGRDTRVPLEFLLSNDILFKNNLPTADGYLTDLEACKKRLEWLEHNLINEPADHLINRIDKSTGNQIYWARQNLVEQGSVFGLFESKLDNKRKLKSKYHNLIRYHIKIFTRRFLKKSIAKALFKKVK